MKNENSQMGIGHLKILLFSFQLHPIFHCLYSDVPFEVIIYHVPTENKRNIAIFAGSEMCVYYVVCLGLNVSKIKKRISVLFGCKNGFILQEFIHTYIYVVHSNLLCPAF